jgi:hypothetical protein
LLVALADAIAFRVVGGHAAGSSSTFNHPGRRSSNAS